MLQNNDKISNQGENTLLYALTLEVDDIFFRLRKADQIIRRELKLLTQNEHITFKKKSINPINKEKLKKSIEQLILQNLLVDEYVMYMLNNEHNSLFKLIEEYNKYLEERQQDEPKIDDFKKLIDVDEKLVYYIRHLGAMTYHLNIHLNLLKLMLNNASNVAENSTVDSLDLDIRESRNIRSKSMVKEWGDRPGDIRFIEITIDESYAIVTWTLEDLTGDAILIQDEGYWQLLKISTSMFGLEEFETAGIPLEIAQRMLSLHHQKLGF